MKRVAIFGSTGSIGENALSVIKHFPKEFKAVALSTNSNTGLLCKQIKDCRPDLVCVNSSADAMKLKSRLGRETKIFCGTSGLVEMAQDRRIDVVLMAISGAAALLPTLKGIEAGHDIALANKESLVMAGHIIMESARKHRVRIIPIDSEQSAIWQCLEGEDKRKIKKIYLTASGGPFRNTPVSGLRKVSVNRVINHPRWRMGRKISVDSATLMNKGLEFLEAMHLFGVGADKVDIIIHPQAIIHSMVEFVDAVVMAQLSVADMRIPIQYALSYPERLGNSMGGIDFLKLKCLDFEKPDIKKFPCLRLGFEVARELNSTSGAVLNAGNEIAVNEFLGGRLKFLDISKVTEKVLSKHRKAMNPDLGEILEADIWAREEAYKIIGNKA